MGPDQTNELYFTDHHYRFGRDISDFSPAEHNFALPSPSCEEETKANLDSFPADKKREGEGKPLPSIHFCMLGQTHEGV